MFEEQNAIFHGCVGGWLLIAAGTFCWQVFPEKEALSYEEGKPYLLIVVIFFLDLQM